jgi:8-oxo-dGTP diphosphatase
MTPDDFEARVHIEIRETSKKNYLNVREGELLSELDYDIRFSELMAITGYSKAELSALIDSINDEGKLVEMAGDKVLLTEEGRKYREYYMRTRKLLDFCLAHPYKRPAVTVDGIISFGEKIVIIRRKNDPFMGKFALPGGYVNYGEKVEDALKREMREEIGQDPDELELFTIVSDPGRDPRGHTISIVYSGKIHAPPVAGDDASSVFLVVPEDILKESMAFDHQDIIREFIQYKDGRL